MLSSRLIGLPLPPLGDTLIPLLFACSADSNAQLDLTTDLSEAIPTVVFVSWPASDGATSAQVDYGPTEALGWTAPAHLDDGTFRATLVGMKPDSSVSLQALEAGEDAAMSDIVWWAEHDGIDPLGRARLGRDGDSVLTMGINAHDEGANSLQRVGPDGEIREEFDVGDSHHDFWSSKTAAWSG